MDGPVSPLEAEAMAVVRGRRPTAPQPALTAPEPAEPIPAQEEPMSSPVVTALAAVRHQAAVLEADVTANPLAVLVAARRVGRTFTEAELVAVTDFIAALEAEKRVQADGERLSAADGHRGSGPQTVLP